MLQLKRTKFFSKLCAWVDMNTYKPSQLNYNKKLLDKERYMGKSFEAIMKDYPFAYVVSDSTAQRDPILAEVKIGQGTLVIYFVDFVCEKVEYFTDFQLYAE